MIDPRHLRLSELARCERCCALRGCGAEPAPPSERALTLFERGHYDAGWVAQRFKARYAPKRVIRELEIEWPLGTGHADLWVPSERLLVEVKSSTSPDSLLDAAIAQMRLYMRFFSRARRGVVFILNPSDLSETKIPVLLHSGHVADIDAAVERVRMAVSGEGPLPPCAYSTPSECRHAFCAFTESAWIDHEPAARVNQADDPLLQALTSELWEANTARGDAKLMADIADARWKDVCARASALGLEPGVEFQCGPFVVKRTEMAPRRTFSLSRAEKSGEWTQLDEERFGFAIKLGESSERWSIKRVEDQPVSAFPSPADGGGSPAASTTEAGTLDPLGPASDPYSVRAELLA